MTVRGLILATALATLVSAPATAKKRAPEPMPAAAPVIPQVRSGDAAIDAFYFYDLKGASLWLSSAAGRTAAARVAEVLRRAPADGLWNGPQLASKVDVALAGGTLADDAAISLAWLRYVQALHAPVPGVEYGDPTRSLVPPSAKQVLSAVRSAASPIVHVDEVALVNPLYASLRDAANAEGQAANPQVRATLDRLRLLPGKGKIILVDTAGERLMMIEDGRVIDQMKVIVGTVRSPTPNIAGTIHYVTLNPYWNIPLDVVQRRIAPLVIKRGVSYLKAARYMSTDKWGADAVSVDPATIDWKKVAAGEEKAYLRQLPGTNNMMGKMKFGFPNSGDIFLHDTPRKGLFDKSSRNLSMGCVRLERAPDLARWLLGVDAQPEGAAPEQQVLLEQPVPVYTAYLSAYLDKDGRIAVFDDRYSFDSAYAVTPVESVNPAALPASATGEAASTPPAVPAS